MTLQLKIATAIKIIRKRLGLSQEKLALDSGVDRRYMSDIENGMRNISIDIVERIANGLCMQPSELLREAESLPPRFANLNDLRQYLCDRGSNDTIVLENPDYVNAVVGISNDERVIYSYNRMIASLIDTENMDEEEATDFVDYNTLRSLPYAGEKAPIVLFDDF